MYPFDDLAQHVRSKRIVSLNAPICLQLEAQAGSVRSMAQLGLERPLQQRMAVLARQGCCSAGQICQFVHAELGGFRPILQMPAFAVIFHEPDPPRVAPRIVRIYTLRGFESVLAGSVQVSTGTKTSLSFQDGPVFTPVHRREGPAAPRGSRARTHGTTISQPTWPSVPDRLHPAHGAGAGPAIFRVW